MFLISDALAAGSAGAAPDSSLSSIVLLVGFFVVFYFMLWRPQSKRAKEHRNLLGTLNKGDEVVTSGGLIGRISKMTDDFIVLTISDGVEVTIQKSAVAASLPKGTMKSI